MTAKSMVPDCNLCGSDTNVHLFTKFGYDLVKCTVCGLAFVGNPPAPEELQQFYSLEGDYHSDLLDPNSPAFARQTRVANTHLNVLKKRASGGRLLDVGCSTGHFLEQARSAGFTVSGVEFSKESAQFARDHFGFSVHTGDIHGLADDGELFDVITMFDVIEHVPDPSADMAAIYARLKPGGQFLVSTPNIDGLFPQASLPVAKLLDYWPHIEPPHHLYQFSTKTLGAMLKKSGFEVEGDHHINIDLAYSFGNFERLRNSPRMLAYALLFAPLAKLGPFIKRGDWLYMMARKPVAG
jgi:2-polyprenyl-3-methyl-5-hydroxy-6-metoxy-1,4-benzoquinol methylase